MQVNVARVEKVWGENIIHQVFLDRSSQVCMLQSGANNFVQEKRGKHMLDTTKQAITPECPWAAALGLSVRWKLTSYIYSLQHTPHKGTCGSLSSFAEFDEARPFF